MAPLCARHRRWPVSAGRALQPLPCCLRQKVGVDEPVEVAVEDSLRVAHLVVGAVVLDELVRVEHIAANLTPEVRLLHGAALLGELGLPLLLLELGQPGAQDPQRSVDRKSTRLNSSHVRISYAVFCLKKKKKQLAHILLIKKKKKKKDQNK